MKEDTVYIVSGLPRCGTSMLMQILKAGGMPVATDNMRKPDKDNPKGYIEVRSIINKLQDDPSLIFNFKGEVVKIIAYGLSSLPAGKYKVIYSERNMGEVMDSMEKMMAEEDQNREEAKEAFAKLNNSVKSQLEARTDVDMLFVNYNKILASPLAEVTRIHSFLSEWDLNLEAMMCVVDPNLYRNRMEENK